MNIDQAVKYLRKWRYEIEIKNPNTFLFNDIDDSNSTLEVYDQKELIALAEQLKDEEND